MRSQQPVPSSSLFPYSPVSRTAAGEQIQPQNTDLFQAAVESRECADFFKQNFVGQEVASKRLENKSGLSKRLPSFKAFLEFVEANFQEVDRYQRGFLKTGLAQGDGICLADDFNQLVDQVDPDLPRLHADLNKINWGEVGVFILGVALCTAGLGLGMFVSLEFFLLGLGGGLLMAAPVLIAIVEADDRIAFALKGKEGLIDKAWGHFIKTLRKPPEGKEVNVDLDDDKALAKQLNCFFGLSDRFLRYLNGEYITLESQRERDAPSSQDVPKEKWLPATEFILLLTQYAQEFKRRQQVNTNAETV